MLQIDIDHDTTCDALAYFLRTRHIDECVLGVDVWRAADEPAARDTVSYVIRDSFTNLIERAYVARCHGQNTAVK